MTPRSLDEAALEDLYARLEKPVYNVVYRWLWHPEDASDVTQEAFVRLWRIRHRVQMATVEALLYRIAINLAASKRRRAKLWRWASLDALRSHAVEQPSIEDALVSADTRQDVRAAIESLPESLRRTLVLCELTSLTHEQVGRILHIPAGTVGSRRHRAVQLLRERLSVTEE